MPHRHSQQRNLPPVSNGIFHAFGIGMLLLTAIMAVWGPLWLALTALLGAAVAWFAVATTGSESTSIRKGKVGAGRHHPD